MSKVFILSEYVEPNLSTPELFPDFRSAQESGYTLGGDTAE